MRLADGLARRRLRYPRPLPTLPDLLVIDVPPVFAAAALPLGRYYPVIIETEAEWREWEAFIAGERERPVAPDLLDRRGSQLTCDEIALVHYDPPVPGWPWIILCRWPPEHVMLATQGADDFARGAYTIDVLPDEQARADATTVLIATLGRHSPINLVHIPPATGQGHS